MSILLRNSTDTYGNCTLCRAYCVHKDHHTCPPVWLVRMDGDLAEDVDRVFALDAEQAAEKWCEEHDSDLDYSILRSGEATLIVTRDSVEVRVSIEAESRPHYSAREIQLTRAPTAIEPSRPEPDTPEALCPVCAQPSGGRCLGHADCPLEAAPVASTDATGGLDLDCYDAGLLSDYGGGDVEWWQDYIRAELRRAHEFYASQVALSQPHIPQTADEGSREAHPIAVSPVVRARIAELEAALKPFARFAGGLDDRNDDYQVIIAPTAGEVRQALAALEVKP